MILLKNIVMDSEYASMGRWISVVVAKAHGMSLYERADLIALLGDPSLTQARVDALDAALLECDGKTDALDREYHEVLFLLDQAVKKALALGPCIIHECAATRLFEPDECLRVMIYNSDIAGKIDRALKDPHGPGFSAEREDVIAFMDDVDNKRALYHDGIVDTPWGTKACYDLMLDSGTLGRELCAELLIAALQGPSISEDEARAAIKTKYAQAH